ncbi:MAG TPA: beta-ketoacyl synthase N-terminal-like domain-containing protein, partial [Trebonia sp.]|nr:beta-ketoacyl synthase N-terminal-like domain-containing protein [Trebonia sp.]
MSRPSAAHDLVLGLSPLQEPNADLVVTVAGSSAGGARPRPLDVAVVGMACVYPDAEAIGRFWANVVAGHDAVGPVPNSHWRKDHEDVPADRGGFMPLVPFDALAYEIPPDTLASIEPVQLLALEVAARALEDAGYASRPFDRSRASVIFGTTAGSDLSGRIADRLGLGGVNYTVDAAGASSLAALDLACKELTAGTSDVVLCGGADTHNAIHDYEMFAPAHALSPSGRCAAFDATADGTA